ncbi:hypothetical protein EYF80_031120 [Liparis tanakae]|uniref:Uncharacterized protein n=1 Tax=Liparis tanakae TaxID=230148 RepID=A0A4Z2GYV3_9TELE|nr:hypothetical protein EYF80_031120 [Liparis tanakae]
MCCEALGKAVLYCGAESSGPCGAAWLSTIITGRSGCSSPGRATPSSRAAPTQLLVLVVRHDEDDVRPDVATFSLEAGLQTLAERHGEEQEEEESARHGLRPLNLTHSDVNPKQASGSAGTNYAMALLMPRPLLLSTSICLMDRGGLDRDHHLIPNSTPLESRPPPHPPLYSSSRPPPHPPLYSSCMEMKATLQPVVLVLWDKEMKATLQPVVLFLWD